MRSNNVKIRKDFKPLITSCALVTLTPNSPATQVYDALINEYVPDRPTTPTVICPIVSVIENENTFRTGRVNDLLGSIAWTVDGVPIVSGVGGYTINSTPGSTEKGSLTIVNNIVPTTRLVLQFRGCIADTRLGINVWFEGKATLSTLDKAEDEFVITLTENPNMIYSPILDKLLEYDYKVSQGIIAENVETRSACIDRNAYLRTIHFDVFKGKTKLTSLTGYNVTLLYNYTTPANYINIMSPDQEPSFVSNSNADFTVTFDLRFRTKIDCMLQLRIGTTVKASVIFSINRVYPAIFGEAAFGSDINPKATYVFNKALVNIDGNKIAYPEAACKIVWATEVYDAENGVKTVTHNEGEQTVISLQKAGIGDTELDNWMCIYFNLDQKEIMQLLVDENGDYLTDENGNKLFCN